jgi:hypothetical protein
MVVTPPEPFAIVTPASGIACCWAAPELPVVADVSETVRVWRNW